MTKERREQLRKDCVNLEAEALRRHVNELLCLAELLESRLSIKNHTFRKIGERVQMDESKAIAVDNGIREKCLELARAGYRA